MLSLSRLWLFEQNLHTSSIWCEVKVDPGFSGTHLSQQQEFHIPKYLSVRRSIKSVAAQQTGLLWRGQRWSNSQSMLSELHWLRRRKRKTHWLLFPQNTGSGRHEKKQPWEDACKQEVLRKGRQLQDGKGRQICCLSILLATIPHWPVKRNGSEKSSMILTTVSRGFQHSRQLLPKSRSTPLLLAELCGV